MIKLQHKMSITEMNMLDFAPTINNILYDLDSNMEKKNPYSIMEKGNKMYSLEIEVHQQKAFPSFTEAKYLDRISSIISA